MGGELQKQPVDVRFALGLDQRTDPKQVQLGKFLRLVNSVFDVGGRLTKRFGYRDVTALPSDTTAAVTTSFRNSLVAVGNKVQAYSRASATWTEMGDLTPLQLNVSAVARPNAAVTQCDAAVAEAALTGGLGLACTVFTTAGGYYYQVTDAASGATVIPATAIPTTATVNGVPKVFVLGRYFVVVFSATASATNRLQFIAISLTNPSSVTAATDITTTYTPAATTAWDGVVANNSLYVAWNGSDVGGAVRMRRIDGTLQQYTTKTVASESGTVFGLAADTSTSTPTIYVTYWKSSGTLGRVFVVDASLTTILAPTTFSSSGTIGNLAPYATNGSVRILHEVTGTYGYESTYANNVVKTVTVTSGGTVGSVTTLLHGVGLASKSFLFADSPAVSVLYSGLYENGYLLVDAITGRALSKLAVGNATFTAATGEGYLKTGLPGVWDVDGVSYLSYLQASQIQPINRMQGQTATGVYLLTGASLAAFTPSAVPATAEIGGSLLIAAGMVSIYDGSDVVEQGFTFWPDQVKVTTATSGGFLTNQQYFYQACYEWTDASGRLHRSAPSVPVGVTTTGSNVSTNTIYVPYLRVTQKAGVRLVLYRWSTAQQTYYKCATADNNTASEYATFTDTLADSSIIGNAILYTTGGVVENIGAPACNIITLYKSRVIMVDAENQNTVWFSKTVLDATPVDMSDAFTIFCSPTIGSQGSTGPITALGAMDDKFILFKRNGAYYETGDGPNDTGQLNDFQDPVYITSSVGCANPSSIVLMPSGLIFQSDKGRWLLGRDLSTTFIGAPVTGYDDLRDTSALTVPGTNQVRISTDGGPTLVYDYYYDQWGTFSTEVDSSCIVNGVHTTLDRFGRIREEAPGTYVDGDDPVLMGFTSGWGSLAGLQGYQRAYFLLFEGQYYSPFLLDVGLAYDYVDAVTQQTTITPSAPNAVYGDDPTYGAGNVYGGTNNGAFKPRLFLQRQRCEAFQITVQERFDTSYGVPAGQGLSLSGMTAVVGIKRGFRTQSAATSFG